MQKLCLHAPHTTECLFSPIRARFSKLKATKFPRLQEQASTKLLEESNEVLTELKNVVNITTLSMTDKERMDVVERCYSKMKRYRNLVSYYTNKNISVSYLRAKKKNDLDRIIGLYGNMNERYW